MVFIDGHINRAAACLHLMGPSLERDRTVAYAIVLSSSFGFMQRFCGRKHLLVPGAVPIYGNTLAIQLLGQLVDLRHILNGGGFGKINGFADGIVGVFLKSRLHPDMILW